MDELIYLLIRVLAGLFGDNKPTPRGPVGGPIARPPLANAPRRPTAAPQRPLPDKLREIRQKMTAQARGPVKVAAPQQPVARPVMKPKAVPQAAAQRAAAAVTRPPEIDAAALRRWLRPGVLHTQFILSEIFQPPLSLREERTQII